jgi:hypothetical protein
MFHVNGYVKNGVLEKVWPFQYINTNLGFTKGKFYGNLSVRPGDKLYNQLIFETNNILMNMPCPQHMIFHLELFHVDNSFVICEIAARRPGGKTLQLT